MLPTIVLLRGATDPSIEERCKEILDVMNRHLAGRDWFAEEYSIADIIPFTRIQQIDHERVKVADYPNLAAWLKRVAERPAVIKAMEQKFG
jgi:GSH-dependent disulfide-bond oxidoreductase